MEEDILIPALDFCVYHKIELSFIYSLHESGLINIIYKEENVFLPVSQLAYLEKLVGFNQEMGINLEGIETVTHLLQRIIEMQKEISLLKNKLAFYE